MLRPAIGLVLLASGLLAGGSLGADVRLPALFSDNLVVQRDMQIPV